MSFLTETRSDNEIIEPRVSFENIPITALRPKTREKLSLLLNPKKVLRTEDGFERDWRGLAALSGLSQSETTSIADSKDETGKLLDLWKQINKDKNIVVTLSQLQECFGVIDRYDVYDDTYSMLTEDARVFLSKSQSDDKENRSSREIVYFDPDSNIITEDDLECVEKGLPLKIYDAFVMFDDKDLEFATELIEKCENNGHSLCVKDRFLGGLTFESEAILNLLSKRCNRLIIIVSKAFLKSPMLLFITNFAQALGIEQGQRKIIPCLLEVCDDLPQMLRFCFRLDYYRNNKLFNFWDKLDKSLRATTDVKRKMLTNNNQRVSVLEIDASPSSLKVNIPTTPGPLYDKELSYKFTDTPTPTLSELSEKPEKNFMFQKPTDSKQIWPPPPKLRESSSMHDLSLMNNSLTPAKISNKYSQSSFYLNEVVADNSGGAALEAIKMKRQKWYKKFLPPSKVPKTKVIEEHPEIKDKEEKPKDKRPWYKIKKKNKNKQKVAIACES